MIDAINQPDGPDRSATIFLSGASWWHIKGIEIKRSPVNG